MRRRRASRSRRHPTREAARGPARIGGVDWTDTIRYPRLDDVAGRDDPRRGELVTLARDTARLRADDRPLHPAWTTLS